MQRLVLYIYLWWSPAFQFPAMTGFLWCLSRDLVVLTVELFTPDLSFHNSVFNGLFLQEYKYIKVHHWCIIFLEHYRLKTRYWAKLISRDSNSTVNEAFDPPGTCNIFSKSFVFSHNALKRFQNVNTSIRFGLIEFISNTLNGLTD